MYANIALYMVAISTAEQIWYTNDSDMRGERECARAFVCLNVTFANAIFRFMKNIAAVFLMK